MSDMNKMHHSILASLTLILVLSQIASSDQRKDSLSILRSQSTEKGKLIFAADFESLDPKTWVVEMDSVAGSSVYVHNNKLILDTRAGVTVWLNKKLKGNFQIEYIRKIVVESGSNDRLSDMNQFWMATDPQKSNLFTRKGKLAEYDNLSLYYAGIGGNYNSTTRFRKYHQGERKLLTEHTNKARLLKPNHEYRIKTIVKDGITSIWVDGELFFEYHDPQPLTTGYFGIRSTWSRQEIRDLKIYKLT